MTESQIFELKYGLKAYKIFEISPYNLIIKFGNIDINKELKTGKNIQVGNSFIYYFHGELKDTYFNGVRNIPITEEDLKFIDLYGIEEDRVPIHVGRLRKGIIELFTEEIKNYEY